MPKIDDALKFEVVKWAAFYEHRIRTGTVCNSDVDALM
jgi:replication factor C subunit 3/5